MRTGKATLKHVADAAGVAESTASRALAGSSAISRSTRDRVHAVALELGYEVRQRQERGDADNRRGQIGVVVAALHNSFYPYLLDKIHDELDAQGYEMILMIDDRQDSLLSRRALRSLAQNLVDGLIITTASVESPMVERLVEEGIPVVLAIRSTRDNQVDAVESDNRMAGRLAARHLVELGHRRIGFIMGPRHTSTAADRFEGAASELADHGISVDPALQLWSEYSHQSGYSGVVGMMKGEQRPTAIICGNDVIAIGALDACRQLGLSVPSDLSLIGCDDIPMANWSMIALTTVKQETAEIGRLAARRVVSRIRGENSGKPQRSIMPVSLVVRRTTGPVASG